MIRCQRHLFNIPDDVAYLNCGYMSPLMKTAMNAGATGLARKQHPWELTPEEFFTGSEKFYAIAARVLGCPAECIAIVPSASYGIATAAWNMPLSKGQSIVVLEEQFPSNYYSWHRLANERGAALKTVAWPADGDWTSAVLAALTPDVAVAALPHVHWTSGGMLDLVRIGDACRKQGAALVLDLTQSLGVLPFSVSDVQPDFAVAASYKWLLGPYSVGLLYIAPKWHNARPLEENWIHRTNARDFSSLILYTDSYEAGARRFAMGESPNFASLPAAARAMEQILEWGIAEISQTIAVMTRHLAEQVGDIGFAVVPERFRAPHYLCIRGDKASKQLSETLASQKVYVSVRGNSIRVTPHVYNSEDDLARFVSCLREFRW